MCRLKKPSPELLNAVHLVLSHLIINPDALLGALDEISGLYGMDITEDDRAKFNEMVAEIRGGLSVPP